MEERTTTLEMKNTGRKDYYYEEAIKTLRTNIQFCGSSLKTIMLTSSMPNEGKSETTFALAASLASIGKKVLLLDCDIRKSVMVKRHEIKGNPNGLSQYLSGQKTLEEVLYGTDIENLDLILSGPYSPNPAELLEDTLFHTMLEKAREKYDYIIIDTPPMANLIDGAIVASQCDGAVLVIESGVISYRLAQKVKAQLEKSGCRILGAVLNRVGSEYESGYYKKYYGRYYGKYYGKYYKKYGGPYGYDDPYGAGGVQRKGQPYGKAQVSGQEQSNGQAQVKHEKASRKKKEKQQA